jgi:hypothetical protein
MENLLDTKASHKLAEELEMQISPTEKDKEMALRRISKMAVVAKQKGKVINPDRLIYECLLALGVKDLK